MVRSPRFRTKMLNGAVVLNSYIGMMPQGGASAPPFKTSHISLPEGKHRVELTS